MANPRSIPKVLVQFRLGTTLIKTINDAVLYSDHESRNLWMVEAIERFLFATTPVTCSSIPIYEVLHNKKPIVIRMPIITLELVDEQCDEKDMDRTLWLMSAVLHYLADTDSGYRD